MSFHKDEATTILQQRFTNRTLYLALFKADGTEVTGGGYQRQPITFGNPTDAGDGNMQVQNTNKVTFSQATEDWGTVTSSRLFDAQTNGNAVDLSDNSINVSVTTGFIFDVDVGNYTVKLSFKE